MRFISLWLTDNRICGFLSLTTWNFWLSQKFKKIYIKMSLQEILNYSSNMERVWYKSRTPSLSASSSLSLLWFLFGCPLINFVYGMMLVNMCARASIHSCMLYNFGRLILNATFIIMHPVLFIVYSRWWELFNIRRIILWIVKTYFQP